MFASLPALEQGGEDARPGVLALQGDPVWGGGCRAAQGMTTLTL